MSLIKKWKLRSHRISITLNKTKVWSTDESNYEEQLSFESRPKLNISVDIDEGNESFQDRNGNNLLSAPVKSFSKDGSGKRIKKKLSWAENLKIVHVINDLEDTSVESQFKLSFWSPK